MRTAYLTPQEKHVLSLFAQQAIGSATPGSLFFSQAAGISAEELKSATDVLIGLIEKGLVETEVPYVFELTSKGMQIVGGLRKSDSIYP